MSTTLRALAILTLTFVLACGPDLRSDAIELTRTRSQAWAEHIDALPAYLERYEREWLERHPYEDLDVRRSGHKIAARRYRATSPTDGPPIVLLHGFPDGQHLYDFVVPGLRQTRDVITFDYLGWGASDKPSPDQHTYDSASLLADLEAVLGVVDAPSYVIVVHDAGAWPGIDWALENPARTHALVILNAVYHPAFALVTPPGLDQFVGDSQERNELASRMQKDDRLWLLGSAEEEIIGVSAQLDLFMDNEENQAEILPVLQATSLDMRPAFMALAARLTDEAAARFFSPGDMNEFQKPVRIVFGANDPTLNLDVAADFESHFPNTTRVDIEGANHFVQIDDPDAVAAQILKAGQP